MKIDSIKLRKYREQKHLSQIELGEAINVSQQRICEWETKDCNIKLEHVLKISEVLNIVINDIAKDATTINILNNNHQSKDNSNPIVGIGIKVEYNYQTEYMEALKNQNENVTKLMESHTKLIEIIIAWTKGMFDKQK